MRTLSRPMFNMGGPIKQGIMHGIREPYKHGTRAALVGNPVFPKDKTGRAHHFNPYVVAASGIAKVAPRVAPFASKVFGKVKGLFGKTGPVTRTVPKQGPTYYPPTGRTLSSKGYPGGQIPGKTIGPGSTEVTEQIFKPHPWAGKTGKYLEGTPEWKIMKGIYEGKGLITKPIKYGLKSPLLMGTLIWQGGKWLRSDGTEASTDEIKQNKDQHGPFDHTDKKKIAKAQAAFAEAQRDTRVQKYLDMMGYDRSKKTAVADALIDASKIVSDRGTLDKKNITRDLINPIIQATSKRFDKPEQIREAVGLMSVKAAITKDLEDPSIKALRLEQLKGLRGGFSKDIGDFVLSAKGQKIKPEALKRYARAKADQHGLDFTVVTDEMIAQAGPDATEDQKIQAVVSGDGVYMIGDALIQVTDGIPKQIA